MGLCYSYKTTHVEKCHLLKFIRNLKNLKIIVFQFQNDNNRLEDYHYYAPSDLYFGQNLSTCAHTMHFSCYTALMQVNKNNDRQRNRAQAMSPRILDVDHNEYNCPLCKRLCNCAVPLLPTINSLKGVVR